MYNRTGCYQEYFGERAEYVYYFSIIISALRDKRDQSPIPFTDIER